MKINRLGNENCQIRKWNARNKPTMKFLEMKCSTTECWSGNERLAQKWPEMFGLALTGIGEDLTSREDWHQEHVERRRQHISGAPICGNFCHIHHILTHRQDTLLMQRWVFPLHRRSRLERKRFPKNSRDGPALSLLRSRLGRDSRTSAVSRPVLVGMTF